LIACHKPSVYPSDNTLHSLSSAGAENNRDFNVTKEQTEGRKIRRNRRAR